MNMQVTAVVCTGFGVVLEEMFVVGNNNREIRYKKGVCHESRKGNKRFIGTCFTA